MTKFNSSNSEKVRKLVYLAVLTALVIVLQLFASAVPVGVVKLCFVLVPIVIGAAFCGPLAGAWLGLVFSVVVLLQPDTAFFYDFSILGTVVTVLVKGTVAGFTAGIVYRLLSKVNAWLAVIVSAVVCPLLNTGIFVLGCYLFFYQDLLALAPAVGFTSVAGVVFLYFAGLNFLIELGINLVLSPAILRLVSIRKNH